MASKDEKQISHDLAIGLLGKYAPEARKCLRMFIVAFFIIEFGNYLNIQVKLG